ncbi:MAG: sulfate transporter/antisigma-factor antagonist [Variovorax sp.]|nr:sulfate transporter/antisigma-factor antagonist [Variovorax sp.]
MSLLALPATLTHDEAPACLHQLRQGLGARATSPVVVDAGALAHFDSSALAVLLECRREAERAARAFSVRGLPPRLRELATLYGVAGLLPEAATP